MFYGFAWSFQACTALTESGFHVGEQFTSETVGPQGGTVEFPELGMAVHVEPEMVDGVRFTASIEPAPTLEPVEVMDEVEEWYLGEHLMRLTSDGEVATHTSLWLGWHEDTGDDLAVTVTGCWSEDGEHWRLAGQFSAPDALGYQGDSIEASTWIRVRVPGEFPEYPPKVDLWYGYCGREREKD
jgi:hypothetical protein